MLNWHQTKIHHIQSINYMFTYFFLGLTSVHWCSHQTFLDFLFLVDCCCCPCYEPVRKPGQGVPQTSSVWPATLPEARRTVWTSLIQTDHHSLYRCLYLYQSYALQSLGSGREGSWSLMYHYWTAFLCLFWK